MRKTQSHTSIIAETTSSYEHHADELEAAPQILNELKSHPTSSSSTEDLTKTPLYFTSDIYEGIGNVEEITVCDSKENTVNILTENETYIATKLSYNFLKVTDEENETLLPDGNIYDLGELLSDHSENQSDSDSGFRLSFESSSTDDEFTNPVKIENITPSQNTSKGNLPFFESLDVYSACETKIIPTPHPLRIKSMPTATVVRESPVSESFHFHTPVTSDGRSFFTGDAGRDKRKPSISEANSATESYKETERDAKYCSTNVQTKLFNKISKFAADAFDDIITLSRFPEIQFSMSPQVKKSKSPLKVKSLSKFNEEPKTLGGSCRKTFGKDGTPDLENFETEVNKAFKESVSEGTFMPLLKQELQCKIQVRRLSMGQPELVLEPEDPKTYELTSEEIKKKEARLDQNRRSARKSRSKAKSYEKKLIKTIKNEMTRNARLSKELVNLRNERDKYRKMHDDHVKSCIRPYTH